MGIVTGLKQGDDSGPVTVLAGIDGHIGSLIGTLQELLTERKRLGQGNAEPDASLLAAAPFAAPYAVAVRPGGPTDFAACRAALARDLIRQRRSRSAYLPAALFAEPAWDMLLDLYAAHHEGKPVSVSSLCIAAHVPSTTALRAIEAMERQGCLVRRRDPADGRRMFLTLSETARAGLDGWFDALREGRTNARSLF